MDEVEVVIPLGSKKGKQKVCVFYWVLLKENLIEPSPTIAFVLSLYSIAWDYKQ
jgi:hypothetical protein